MLKETLELILAGIGLCHLLDIIVNLKNRD